MVTVPSCWTAPALPAAGTDITHTRGCSAVWPAQRGQTAAWAQHLRPTPGLALGRRAGGGRRRREQWEVCPSPGRAGRGSAWGGTARCGCCSTRSSAAPPHRAATPRSWRWCCPPCCGRSRRPPPASCTRRGRLSLLLPEHLRRAKGGTGDEMGFAAVTNPPEPPLLPEKDPTWLSHAHAHTHMHSFSFSHPSSSLPTEPCPVEEASVQ